MASRTNQISTVLKADSKDFLAAMEAVKGSIKTTRIEFANIDSIMKDTGQTTSQLKEHKRQLQTEITNIKGKLDILIKGLEETTKNYGENSDETKIVREEVQKASTHYENLKQKLELVNEKLEHQTISLTSVGDATGKLASKVKWFSGGAGSILGLSAKTAISFEDAFVGVKKTVDGTDEELEQIRKEIIEMSNEIPIATTELFELGEEAGQLGIATSDITNFTKTMAKLGTATNLSATEAGEAIATFVNVMGTLPENYERIGSVIVELGNNSKATEADIVAMAQKMSGAAATLGMSESSVLGLATALSSVGLEAEMGGTAISRIMNDFNKAASGVETKYGSLSQYAKICGMSVKEFSETVKNDAGEAIKQFIIGLGDTNRTGESTIQLMSELGINEVRLTDTMLRLANASGTVEEYMTMADAEWINNNALIEESRKKYADTASQIEITKNKFGEVADKIGQTLLPVVNDGLHSLNNVLDHFKNLDEGTQKIIVKGLAFTAMLAPASKAVSVFCSGLKGTGRFIGNLLSPLGDVVKSIDSARISTEVLNATAGENVKVIDKVGNSTEKLNDSEKKTKNSTDKLATSTEKAKDSTEKLSKSTDKIKKSTDDLNKSEKSINSTTKQVDKTIQKTDDNTKKLNKTIDKAIDNAKDLSKETNKVDDSLKNANDSQKKYNKSVEENTTKSKLNIKHIKEGIDQWNKSASSVDKLKGSFTGLSTSLISLKGFSSGIKDIADEGANLGNVAESVAGGVGTIVGAVTTGASVFGTWGGVVGGVASAIKLVVEGISSWNDKDDELKKMVESSNESLKEYSKEIDVISNSYKDSIDNIGQTIDSNIAYIDQTKEIASELSNLIDVNGKVKKSDEERAKVIVEILNESLGLQLGLENGVIKNGDEIIKNKEQFISLVQKSAEEMKKELILQQFMAAYKNAISARTEEERKLNNELAEQNKQIEEAIDKMKNQSMTYGEASEAIKNAQNNITKAQEIYNQKIKDTTPIIEGLSEITTNYADKSADELHESFVRITSDSGKSTKEVTDNLNASIKAAKEQLDKLIEKEEEQRKTIVNLRDELNKPATLNFNTSPARKKLNDFIADYNRVLPAFGGAVGVAWNKISQIPANAKGTVIKKRTLSWVGEDGPEAIIPLEKHTEWIDKVATRLNTSLINNRGINIDYLQQVGDSSIKEDYLATAIGLLEKIANKSNDFYLDGRKLSETMASYDDMASGSLLEKIDRGWAI